MASGPRSHPHPTGIEGRDRHGRAHIRGRRGGLWAYGGGYVTMAKAPRDKEGREQAFAVNGNPVRAGDPSPYLSLTLSISLFPRFLAHARRFARPSVVARNASFQNRRSASEMRPRPRPLLAAFNPPPPFFFAGWASLAPGPGCVGILRQLCFFSSPHTSILSLPPTAAHPRTRRAKAGAYVSAPSPPQRPVSGCSCYRHGCLEGRDIC